LSANYPLFERYRTVPAFSGVTTFRPSAFVTNTEGVVELILGRYVSGNYHAVMSVGVGLLLTAVAATYFPARRAARIDPLRALRVD
jgi:ABC-type antimicrobial peptide transport system permease subunit